MASTPALPGDSGLPGDLAGAADPGDPLARIRTIPDPAEPVPAVAWPTIGLCAGGFALFGVSTTLALTGTWPWPLSTICNAIACFVLFTVSHEAAHRTLSTSERVNTWLGRLATAMFAPHAGFSTWRYIHMQHHRFTNHDDGRDPDHYCSSGSRWTLPLRWLTIDLWYMWFYLPQLPRRPRREQVELALTWLAFLAAVVVLVATGNLFELVVLYLLPVRLAVGVLGWSFDYLPHHGLPEGAGVSRFRTTRNRIGAEPVLSKLMLYQNYHLVHHLHPIVPFYRYIAVWRRREDEYLERDPALADVRGRPLTRDEYEALRALRH